VFSTILLPIASLLGPGVVAAPAADISVDVEAQPSLLLPGARYDGTITLPFRPAAARR
jgi:hypothetical protein